MKFKKKYNKFLIILLLTILLIFSLIFFDVNLYEGKDNIISSPKNIQSNFKIKDDIKVKKIDSSLNNVSSDPDASANNIVNNPKAVEQRKTISNNTLKPKK
tara:strand:- start:4922 stop:5224 length:303 start_codon:yes stop_codon:yes gene_type:complete